MKFRRQPKQRISLFRTKIRTQKSHPNKQKQEKKRTANHFSAKVHSKGIYLRSASSCQPSKEAKTKKSTRTKSFPFSNKNKQSDQINNHHLCPHERELSHLHVTEKETKAHFKDAKMKIVLAQLCEVPPTNSAFLSSEQRSENFKKNNASKEKKEKGKKKKKKKKKKKETEKARTDRTTNNE